MVIEKYRVTLEHFYEFVEPGGLVTRSNIDPALYVESCSNPCFGPNTLVLNNLMDRLTEEVLARAHAEVKP